MRFFRPHYPNVEADVQVNVSGLTASGHPYISPRQPLRLVGAWPNMERALVEILEVLERHKVDVYDHEGERIALSES